MGAPPQSPRVPLVPCSPPSLATNLVPTGNRNDDPSATRTAALPLALAPVVSRPDGRGLVRLGRLELARPRPHCFPLLARWRHDTHRRLRPRPRRLVLHRA